MAYGKRRIKLSSKLKDSRVSEELRVAKVLAIDRAIDAHEAELQITRAAVANLQKQLNELFKKLDFVKSEHDDLENQVAELDEKVDDVSGTVGDHHDRLALLEENSESGDEEVVEDRQVTLDEAIEASRQSELETESVREADEGEVRPS